MVELITADKPDIVCLQEVPVWAFKQIEAWSGMQAQKVRTMRPRLGFLPIPAGFGRRLTSLNHGKFRSAFAGQGNVILLPKDVTVRKVRAITLNTNVFCEDQGEKLELSPKMMRWWEKERRVCQVLNCELPGGRRYVVANLHATSCPQNHHLPDAELKRATTFINRAAELDESIIVAGDFNVTREQSATMRELVSGQLEERWTTSGSHIDHVLLRRAVADEVKVWPVEAHTQGGLVLSDHAPVEVTIRLTRS